MLSLLRNDASGKTPSVDATTASSAPSAQPEDRAERRQVTVMFSDLVGSTALSARMDPEDLREVISAYQNCVADSVQRFGGFVAKYMGDGVLIYFGYPHAHEDDAERAVRVGLELVAAVGALKTHAPLQTRVGIATGLVVVGDLIGSGASQEQAIVGETPNLAARLQGVAQPNVVVIAESTRKLVGNLFELDNLGAQELKGISGPVRAWAALRPSSLESRFEALHASGVTELVGREEELDLLLRRWSKAKTGQGQVVLLSGEPGIGKSRLTAVVLERLAAEPHTRLRYFCSPRHTDSALYPIISQMERAAGFAHEDNAQAKLDKLDALLARSSTQRQDAALFAEMLSLLNDGRYPPLELAAQQRRQKTLEALTVQLDALAHACPVLMIFEDVHWVDPTSLEVLGRTVDRVKTLPVLLIVTYRPEFDPPWIGNPFVTALNINRLDDREIAAMIDSVTGNKLLSGSIRQEIIERTDGIPLFVEEMTKAVLEAGSEDTGQQAVSVIPSPSLAVPASLHASLMARLDRLGPAKEVAQIGAAIGREFSHALLAATARKPEAELQTALDRLVGAGLVFRQGLPPQATYLFKHALVQDAAYSTLLRGPRRSLHARIAEALENKFADITENQPELLAHHFTQAGLTNVAITWWGKAGEKTLRRSAFEEAISHLSKAIEMADTIGDAPVISASQRLKLQTNYGQALMLSRGFGSEASKAAFTRAQQLAARINDPAERFNTVFGLWIGSLMRAELELARETAEIFLREAEIGPTMTETVVAHRCFGLTRLMQGDWAQASEHLLQALKLYDPERDSEAKFRFAQEPDAGTKGYLALTHWQLGEIERATEVMEEAVSRAVRSSHPQTVVNVNLFRSLLAILQSDAEAARHASEAILEVSQEHGITLYKAMGTVSLCWARARLSDHETSLNELREAVAAFISQGNRLFVPFYQGLLGEIEAERQDDRALIRINEWHLLARRANTGLTLSCGGSAAISC
jgi:class 3 adenylate cyclase/tetratricopeptide (TPR) repeat protein